MRPAKKRVNRPLQCARFLAIACLSAASALTQPHRPAVKNAASCGRFVQDFYDWYAAPVPARHERPVRDRYDEDVLRDKPELLEEGLYRLLQADRACVNRSREICNLDFDPFYNSQDPSEKYLVKEVRMDGGSCTVPMAEIKQGRPQALVRVQPELHWQSDHWVFANFDYFYPDDPARKPTNLRSLLARSQRDANTKSEQK